MLQGELLRPTKRVDPECFQSRLGTFSSPARGKTVPKGLPPLGEREVNRRVERRHLPLFKWSRPGPEPDKGPFHLRRRPEAASGNPPQEMPFRPGRRQYAQGAVARASRTGGEPLRHFALDEECRPGYSGSLCQHALDDRRRHVVGQVPGHQSSLGQPDPVELQRIGGNK